MVYEILATTPFGKEKKGEVGIERMVEEGAYSAAFPLHDVRIFFSYLRFESTCVVWVVHFLFYSYLLSLDF